MEERAQPPRGRGHAQVHLQDRDDYKKYNKLCSMVTSSSYSQTDGSRQRANRAHRRAPPSFTTWAPSFKSLALCDKLSVSSFCRRRLSVILVRLKIAETLRSRWRSSSKDRSGQTETVVIRLFS